MPDFKFISIEGDDIYFPTYIKAVNLPALLRELQSEEVREQLAKRFNSHIVAERTNHLINIVEGGRLRRGIALATEVVRGHRTEWEIYGGYNTTRGTCECEDKIHNGNVSPMCKHQAAYYLLNGPK